MSREILFRAKTKATKEWAYGHFAKQHDVSQIYAGNGHECIYEDTLCQYTGLTDKDGTKIFEGDIVETMSFQEAYGTDKFYVQVVQGNFYVCHGGTLWTLWSCAESVKVVGNIYDNPEMVSQDTH